MTLRRFVQVTVSNFRQLIQTIAAPPPVTLPALSLRTDLEPTMPDTAAAAGQKTTAAPYPAPVDAETHVAADVAPVDTMGARTEAPPPASDSPAQVEVEVDGTDLHGMGLRGAELVAAEPGEVELHNAGRGEAESHDAESGDASVNPVELHAAEGPDAVQDNDEAAGGEQFGVAVDVAEADTEPLPQDDTPATPAGDAPAAVWAEPADGSLALPAALESLLFVSDGPVEPAQLARVLGLDATAVDAALQDLETYYREHARGLRVQTRNGRYQLVSAPTAATLIEAYLNLDTSTRLSAPALETLAVVAYRQPVTRAQVEAVRGVDCSGVLRSLLQRGLIEEVGRLDTPGRPVLYAVTDLFMHHFGLTGLHELPPLANADSERIDEVLQAGDTAA